MVQKKWAWLPKICHLLWLIFDKPHLVMLRTGKPKCEFIVVMAVSIPEDLSAVESFFIPVVRGQKGLTVNVSTYKALFIFFIKWIIIRCFSTIKIQTGICSQKSAKWIGKQNTYEKNSTSLAISEMPIVSLMITVCYRQQTNRHNDKYKTHK